MRSKNSDRAFEIKLLKRIDQFARDRYLSHIWQIDPRNSPVNWEDRVTLIGDWHRVERRHVSVQIACVYSAQPDATRRTSLELGTIGQPVFARNRSLAVVIFLNNFSTTYDNCVARSTFLLIKLAALITRDLSLSNTDDKIISLLFRIYIL